MERLKTIARSECEPSTSLNYYKETIRKKEKRGQEDNGKTRIESKGGDEKRCRGGSTCGPYVLGAWGDLSQIRGRGYSGEGTSFLFLLFCRASLKTKACHLGAAFPRKDNTSTKK